MFDLFHNVMTFSHVKWTHVSAFRSSWVSLWRVVEFLAIASISTQIHAIIELLHNDLFLTLLWSSLQALEKCQLADIVRFMPEKLDAPGTFLSIVHIPISLLSPSLISHRLLSLGNLSTYVFSMFKNSSFSVIIILYYVTRSGMQVKITSEKDSSPPSFVPQHHAALHISFLRTAL